MTKGRKKVQDRQTETKNNSRIRDESILRSSVTPKASICVRTVAFIFKILISLFFFCKKGS